MKTNADFLSLRLSAAADCVPAGSKVADVGADHAALSIFLLSTGKASSVVVSDLRRLPLERARRAVALSGFADRAEFCLADGMVPLLRYGPDCFAVCGMGGDTIASMLPDDCSAFDSRTLVLQPMTKHESLREALFSHGFAIERELIVVENSRPFVVISAHRDGIVRSASPLELLAGAERPIDGPTRAYYAVLLRRLTKRAAGLESSGRDPSPERELIAGLRARLGQ